MGFALFRDGEIAPHLELSQHPIRKHKTYDEYVGKAALESAGRRQWSKRVHKIVAILEAIIAYERLYIGGGNAELIEAPLRADGPRVCREAPRFCRTAGLGSMSNLQCKFN